MKTSWTLQGCTLCIEGRVEKFGEAMINKAMNNKAYSVLSVSLLNYLTHQDVKADELPD